MENSLVTSDVNHQDLIGFVVDLEPFRRAQTVSRGRYIRRLDPPLHLRNDRQ